MIFWKCSAAEDIPKGNRLTFPAGYKGRKKLRVDVFSAGTLSWRPAWKISWRLLIWQGYFVSTPQHSIAEANKFILGRAWREPTRTRYITRSITVC